jgi:hypothetical protein
MIQADRNPIIALFFFQSMEICGNLWIATFKIRFSSSHATADDYGQNSAACQPQPKS